MSAPAASVEPVSREAWLALAVGTSTAFLVVVDLSVVNVAFPSIAEDLGSGAAGLSWIVSGYSVSLASFLLLAGRLADRVGRKRVYLGGLTAFVAASLVCGLAVNTEMLIAARVAQAVGGAALFPSSLALILPLFPPGRRALAIGWWGSMGALGAAFGPSIGALFIDWFSWRAIFLLNVPTGALLSVMAVRFFTESLDPDARDQQLDLIGVPLGTAGVALVMVAIVQGEEWGYGDARTVAFFLVGLSLLPVLIWRSMTHPRPLLDLSLFRIRSFWSSIAAFFLYSLGFVSGFLMSSLLMQRHWGYSVLETGFGLTPGPLIATVLSAPAGRYADRWGHRWLVSAGCALCAGSYLLLLLRIGEAPAYVAVFLPANLMLGVGVGLSIASMTSAALADVPAQRFAVGNATVRTVQQLGGAVGIAAVVALFGDPTVSESISAFEHAYLWVVVAFGTAAVAMIALFPTGSAAERSHP